MKLQGMNFEKFIITGLSVLLLVGCGAPQEKEDAQSKQEEQVVNASDENMVVFPEGAMSIGEGKVKVITRMVLLKTAIYRLYSSKGYINSAS